MFSRKSIAGIVIAIGTCFPAFGQDAVTRLAADAPFEQVIADLEAAIVNRGYVVDYRGNIGEMLKRTAGDLGNRPALYRNAEFFQFCSAVVSRKAMEADTANIAFCPYVLFAYETEAKPGEVMVGFRRLPPGGGRDEVNALLEGIVREAAGEF